MRCCKIYSIWRRENHISSEMAQTSIEEDYQKVFKIRTEGNSDPLLMKNQEDQRPTKNPSFSIKFPSCIILLLLVTIAKIKRPTKRLSSCVVNTAWKEVSGLIGNTPASQSGKEASMGRNRLNYPIETSLMNRHSIAEKLRAISAPIISNIVSGRLLHCIILAPVMRAQIRARQTILMCCQLNKSPGWSTWSDFGN